MTTFFRLLFISVLQVVIDCTQEYASKCLQLRIKHRHSFFISFFFIAFSFLPLAQQIISLWLTTILPTFQVYFSTSCFSILFIHTSNYFFPFGLTTVTSCFILKMTCYFNWQNLGVQNGNFAFCTSIQFKTSFFPGKKVIIIVIECLLHVRHCCKTINALILILVLWGTHITGEESEAQRT